jgi:hypothetical protein
MVHIDVVSENVLSYRERGEIYSLFEWIHEGEKGAAEMRHIAATSCHLRTIVVACHHLQ